MQYLQLTISLLASNKISAIRRCLDSLVPILMRIPSELIIVDTSGNPQVRNLVSQYTSHVIPFQWCNDFSKARNTGLQRAKGEWFMSIDDDEWLEDADEIIDFFASGEYRNYNSATYRQRNYTEWSGINYIHAYVARMVRLTPDTKFINTIHEYITPYKGPVKRFSIYAHHYGYVDNIVDSKTGRNIPLLENELREHKPTVHNYLQLCQEYMSAFKYAEAEKYAFKCLELDEPDNEKEKSWCLAYLPQFIRLQGDYQRTLEVGKQMLRHPFCTEISALLIYTDLMAACIKLVDHEKDIIIYGKNYHLGLERLDKRPEEWFFQSIGGLEEQQIKNLRYKVYLSGLKASAQILDQKSADFFLQCFPWGSNEIENFYQSFYTMLQKNENRSFLLDRFAGSGAEDPFISIIKAGVAWENNAIVSAQEYNIFAARSKNIIVFQEAVRLFLLSQGKISLDPWVDVMDIQQWKEVSKSTADKAELHNLADHIVTVKKHLAKFPVQALTMQITFQERLLAEGILEFDDQDLFQKMEQYCSWVQDYAALVYSKDMLLPENLHLMPQEHQFAVQMDRVFCALQNFDHAKILKELHQAINIYPPLCSAIRRMLPIITEKIERAEQDDQEFKMLGSQVKKMIRDLIQERRYPEAQPLIQQLSTLLPKDLELVRLRQELWTHLTDQGILRTSREDC